jgi:hypothetical protein
MTGTYAQAPSLFGYNAAVRAGLSTPQVPTWLHANQFGAIPTQGPYLNGQWGLHKKYHTDSLARSWGWQAEARLVTNTGATTEAFLTDAFIAAKWKGIELSLGQRSLIEGLVDTVLTSGSISWSGNARPLPGLRLSTLDFLHFPFSKKFLAFKFTYSDAAAGGAATQFGSGEYVPQTYLHQKSLYLRLGKPTHKLHLYGGFNHQAHWGGDERIFSNGLDQKQAYTYVVVGKPWSNSRVGNHFGTIDLAMEWKTRKATFYIYRQNIYEDGSLAQLLNVSDGLNGLRISFPSGSEPASGLILQSLLIEYLYTKSQGGTVFDFDAGIFGRDNYFNHYVYTRGWSYRGRGWGTPLLPAQTLTRTDLPRSDRDFTNNNRVSAVHLAAQGTFRRSYFQARSTFSRNYGTYGNNLSPVNQLSLLLRIDHPLPKVANTRVLLRLAADFGNLYPSTSALEAGLSYQGFLGKRR